ncbi:3-ketoacyl-CoA thiolase, mitochondrial-like [Spodoptera litura]|uniref:3-ketoacyl-CoA thiolase, mitochondrial-like n=1 Tax=Spodoptera litura TaxID=69820 RepID=A0A9J7DVG0_SPOLT|nr:3-ketoacyl-CoA thiolase, mitochondrial-like [Spodoptera litura]
MAVVAKKGVYIVAGKRTPFGMYGGLLRDVIAEDLLATSAAAALKASGVAADLVDTVTIGQAISVAQSGFSGRNAALKTGIPAERPVLTVHKLSGSGFAAIICSAQEILIGSANIALAGGMESLSSIPFLVRDVRFGTHKGKSIQFEDHYQKCLFDPICNMHLIQIADVVVAKYGVTRREADEFALRSYQKWRDADAKGVYNEELTPVTIKVKDREVLMTRDEIPQRPVTFEKFSSLPTTFKGGVTTSGNCCGNADGAGAVILTNEESLKLHELKPLARLVGWSYVALDPVMLGMAPVVAVQSLLKSTGLTINDMDLVDLHETFAVATVACARELEVDDDKLNVNGGAIAIGHPPGATGTRIVSNLTYELRRRGLKRAITAASIAGGQGVAMIIETV